MDLPSEQDVVCLHLAGVGGDPTTDPAPHGATIRGIAEALGVDDERSTYRVDLLSTLSELVVEGVLDSRTGRVEGRFGERTVYWPTERGRERARAVRERLADETVVVGEDGSETVPVDDLGRYFDTRPIVEAISNQRDDGRMALEEDIGGAFVDREAELNAIERHVAATPNEGSRTVLVCGEAGIGKTTLVERGLETARSEGFEVGSATCHRTDSEPFGPLREALHSLDGGGAVAAPIEDREPERPDDPDVLAAERIALFEAVADGLRQRASEGPVVIFLDDLQWADPATLDLFVHLATSVTEWIYPVLFVGTCRVESAAVDRRLEEAIEALVEGGLADSGRAERLELGPLPDPDSQGLVAWLTDEPAVPESFVTLLGDHCGGNPLMLRETVQYLLEAGELDPAADRYPSGVDQLPVPGDIEAVVGSRLEPFSQGSRRTLEAASVVGDVVEPALLAAVLEADVVDVNDRLDLFATVRLLEWRGDRVEFVGSIVREALLESVPADRRRDLHARIAAALPAVADDEDGDHHGRIAHHHEQAGRLERALEHYRKAGETASRAYAHDLADDHYRAALDIASELDRPGEETALRVELGASAYRQGDFERAEATFATVREEADLPAPLMRAAYYHAEVHSDRGEYEATLERAEAGLGHWDGETPTTTVTDLLSRKGWALQQLGQLEESQAAFERALALARELGDDGQIARAIHDVGTVELHRGKVDDAVETYETALSVLDGTGDRRRLGRARHNLGLGYKMQGDIEAARAMLGEALAVQAEIGDDTGATVTRVNLGEVAATRGEWDRATTLYEEGLAAANDLDQQRMAAVATGDVGELQLRRGDLADAHEAITEGVELCDQLGHERQLSWQRSLLAHWHVLVGDVDEGLAQAEAALERTRAAGLSRETALASMAAGTASRAAGELDDALEYHEAAVEAARDLAGDATEGGVLVDARVSLAWTQLAAGRPSHALDNAEAAVEAVASVTDPWRTIRARATLGACNRERGDLEAAERTLESALESARALGARVEECRTLVDLAQTRAAAGADDEARSTLEAAHELATEMGATLFVRRCEALLEDR